MDPEAKARDATATPHSLCSGSNATMEYVLAQVFCSRGVADFQENTFAPSKRMASPFEEAIMDCENPLIPANAMTRTV
jgi:hypothetical protein